MRNVCGRDSVHQKATTPLNRCNRFARCHGVHAGGVHSLCMQEACGQSMYAGGVCVAYVCRQRVGLCIQAARGSSMYASGVRVVALHGANERERERGEKNTHIQTHTHHHQESRTPCKRHTHLRMLLPRHRRARQLVHLARDLLQILGEQFTNRFGGGTRVKERTRGEHL